MGSTTSSIEDREAVIERAAEVGKALSTGGGGDGGGRSVTVVVAEREPTAQSTALELLSFAAKTAGTLVVLHYGLRMFEGLVAELKPESEKGGGESTKKALIADASAAAKGAAGAEADKKITLNGYEAKIARELVDPADIGVDFAKIGGLEEQKDEIQALVVDRFRHPEVYGQSRLLGPPPGILLHGPPGTGKTMLAKAVAKESGATFLSINLSSLFDKYFGESQRLVRAIFSLAEKLSPTIVFIDEIDAFLRQRGDDDQRVLSTMKAEFMTLWDGLGTDAGTSARASNGFGVVVIGASNRPNDIDPAFQRRLARKIFVGLPEAPQRLAILRITMAGDMDRLRDFRPAAAAATPDAATTPQGGEGGSGGGEDERAGGGAASSATAAVGRALPPAPPFFADLARDLEFYSGHDIKELCRVAILMPIQEYLAEGRRTRRWRQGTAAASAAPPHLRQVTATDFYNARAKVFPPGDPTLARRRAEAEARRQRRNGDGAVAEDGGGEGGGDSGAGIYNNPNDFAAVMNALMHNVAAAQLQQQQHEQRRGPPRQRQPPPFRPGSTNV